MAKKKKEKVKEEKYYSQWYWGRDWLNNKVKNWYYGPRLDWMYLRNKNKEKDAKKNTR
tara:strand:- start:750 stop:923 length:174 start_codon:yes stop_codon:yes gene_type:complete